MKFKIVACINTKLCLGNENELIYKIKSDLQNFKRITLNEVVIMGRKTYESLRFKPLPYRTNIIITSNKDYKADGCIVVNSIDECIKLCENNFSNNECYVIGGGKIYSEFITRDLVDYMYITEVCDVTDGDTYFPNVLFDGDTWRVFYQSDSQYDRDSGLRYCFKIYKNNVKNS